MPVDAIPEELLTEVFAHTLTTKPISCREGPILVSQVCSLWRSIAISDPRMWSSPNIRVTPSCSEHYLDLVRAFLDRSASQPLSIAYVEDQDTTRKPKTAALAFAVSSLLASHASRWLSLKATLSASPGRLPALCQHTAPLITQFSLELNCWDNCETQTISHFLNSATSLSNLTWNVRKSWGTWDDPTDIDIVSLGIHWGILTDVRLETWVSLATALDILCQCDSLESLSLRHFSLGPTVQSADDEKQDLIPIYLPNLHTLDIYQLELDQALSDLFDHLICPQLQHFYFSCGFVEHIPWPQNSFHSFLDRSSCRLTSLSLEFTGISEPQLIQCLEQSSGSLERLELHDARGCICVSDQVLRLLESGNGCRDAAFGNCATLCPKLRTLKLSHVIFCRDGGLSRFLNSRKVHNECSRCIPLEEVEIDFPRQFRHVLDLRSDAWQW